MTESLALLGVDVGFSVKGTTTGLAWRIGSEVVIRRAIFDPLSWWIGVQNLEAD
jgi:hypothetical protein